MYASRGLFAFFLFEHHALMLQTAFEITLHFRCIKQSGSDPMSHFGASPFILLWQSFPEVLCLITSGSVGRVKDGGTQSYFLTINEIPALKSFKGKEVTQIKPSKDTRTIKLNLPEFCHNTSGYSMVLWLGLPRLAPSHQNSETK